MVLITRCARALAPSSRRIRHTSLSLSFPRFQKYTLPEEKFIAQCTAVAVHNHGVDEFPVDVDETDDDDAVDDEVLGGEARDGMALAEDAPTTEAAAAAGDEAMQSENPFAEFAFVQTN